MDRVLLYALSAAVFVLLALVARVQPEFGYSYQKRNDFRNYLYANAKEMHSDPDGRGDGGGGTSSSNDNVPLDSIHVDELNTTQFFTKMYRSQPFIIEGAAMKLPAFSKWVGLETEEYLRDIAGTQTMEVECSKNGAFAEFMPGWHRDKMKLSEFLDKYRADGSGGTGTGAGRKGDDKYEHMYLAEHDVPEPLLGDVPFFDFANFLDTQDADVSRKMWLAYIHHKRIGGEREDVGEEKEEEGFKMKFSKATVGVGNGVSGGGGGGEEEEEEEERLVDDTWSKEGHHHAKKRRRKTGRRKKPQSLPHTDNFENILVQLEGAKDLVLVPPTHGKFVYPGGWSDDARKYVPPHYSPVNFHHPDRIRHPQFFACDPINVRLEAGDALYLPSYWWHHVKPASSGRNLAVNYWYPTSSAMLRLVMDGMEINAF